MFTYPEFKKLQTVTSKFTDEKAWIEEMKFSPNGAFLALGAHGKNTKIQIYKFNSKAKEKFLTHYCHKTVGATSAILHIDWSSDSSFLIINT